MPSSCCAWSPLCLLTTTLILPLSGLNLGGIDCHVLRPIMTAFWRDVPCPLLSPASPVLPIVDVIRRKWAISFGNDHGSVPFTPKPFPRVMATTSARRIGC